MADKKRYLTLITDFAPVLFCIMFQALFECCSRICESGVCTVCVNAEGSPDLIYSWSFLPVYPDVFILTLQQYHSLCVSGFVYF